MTTPVPASAARGGGSSAAARTLLLAALAAGVLTGCSGRSCDGLAALQAERDQRRAEHQRLVDARSASDEELGAADDRLHALERRVHELEQSCDRG